ncbi:MAG: hypothetical protein KJ935_02435 [Candidatus Omnitrophica bacterium]|nr:hypothetical protein [Candidatus Omnitrophota bacterium]
MEEIKYAGLRKVSDALRTLAWVVLVLCGVGLLVGLGLIVRKPEASGIVCLASLIYGVFGFLYLYGMSQLILVALDIEANTRVTASKQQ